MQGQLWQPCPMCDTQPVCAVCEHCETHCTCLEVKAETPEEARNRRERAQAAAQARDEQQAAWEEFRATLPPSIMCEGSRYAVLSVGEQLSTPQPPEPALSRSYKRATTPQGRKVLVCHYGNATIAHGDDLALDEIVAASVDLTPRSAFKLLADEIAVTELNYIHTENRDVQRVLRVLGREQVIETARRERLINPYSGRNGQTPVAFKGEKEAAERHDLDIEWVIWHGYPRYDRRELLPAEAQDVKLFYPPGLYQSEDGQRWYIGDTSGTRWLEITPEVAEQVRPASG